MVGIRDDLLGFGLCGGVFGHMCARRGDRYCGAAWAAAPLTWSLCGLHAARCEVEGVRDAALASPRSLARAICVDRSLVAA